MICCPLFGDSAGDGAGMHRLFGQKGDGKRREICLKGLEPFGLAGFGRIWGHVGARCPGGCFLGRSAKCATSQTCAKQRASCMAALNGRRVDQARCGWYGTALWLLPWRCVSLLPVCRMHLLLCVFAVQVSAVGNHRHMACTADTCAGGGGIKSLGAIRRRPRGPLA